MISDTTKVKQFFGDVIARSGATRQSLSLKTRFLTPFGMTDSKGSPKDSLNLGV